MFLSFPQYRHFHVYLLSQFKMSTHQTTKDKPRSRKCRHFCFSFDIHKYCPTCRESGKGDDPCVTFEAPCDICASFTDEQMNKIQHSKRYIKKQKKDTTSSKDDEFDLLGDGNGDSITGSNTDLESAADNLFTSPPTSTTPIIQVIVSQNASQNCLTHPRYTLQQKIEANI